MRLWTIHPKFLDRQGLLGLWLEGIVAQNALSGLKKGYSNHPQLNRFKAQEVPLSFLGSYLEVVAKEGHSRGYNLRLDRVTINRTEDKIPVTIGQVHYEFQHLSAKLSRRDKEAYQKLQAIQTGGKTLSELIHPIFMVVPGEIEAWERI